MSKSKLSDFFSPEARAARREARLNKISSLSGEVGTALGQRFAGKESRITTQNAGPFGLQLAREILANYRLPGVPKLGYSGLRNGRTAANSTRLQDGVITITASFKTYSNVGISFDIPIEIREGTMQEPSVIVHNGAPRIIAQSTFDELVSMGTMVDPVPVREMYAEPMPHAVAQKLYKERVHMPRVDRGLFSVEANKRNLRAAIHGTAIKTAQMDDGFDDGQPNGGPSVVYLADKISPDGQIKELIRFDDGAVLTSDGTSFMLSMDGQASPVDEDNEYVAVARCLNPDGMLQGSTMTAQDEAEYDAMMGMTRMAQVQTSPTLTKMPTLKKPAPDGSSWQNQKSPGTNPDAVPTSSMKAPSAPKPPAEGEEGTAIRQHEQVQQVAAPGAPNVPQQLGQMAQQLSQISQQMVQQKQAKQEKEKQPKPVKPSKPAPLPKMPKPKAAPSSTRLCAKCAHAPCTCKNRRKKKEANWRPIVAQVKTEQPTHGSIYRDNVNGDEFNVLDVKGDVVTFCLVNNPRDCDSIFIEEFMQKTTKIAQMDLVSKVQAEVEQMRGDGLQDIDCRMAVQTKYGPEMVKAVFHKTGPDAEEM